MTLWCGGLLRARWLVLLASLIVIVGQPGCTAMLLGGGQGSSTSAATTLVQSVAARITADEVLSDQVINVTTQGSVVTLRGRVASQSLRDRAEAVTRAVSGVTDVDNRLVIQDGS